MNINPLMFICFFVAVALMFAIVRLFKQKQSGYPVESNVDTSQQKSKLEERFAYSVVIGESLDRPFVTIEELNSTDRYEVAKPLDAQSWTTASRLSAVCQAIPSASMAFEASGKRLMEVVINGELVRAADGNGLRAFTMSSNGIKEHARLFEVSNLQGVLNVAAVWQIASIIVAQKHLADISRKLDAIQDGVKNISVFLDNQRKSRISAAYSHLGQIYQAVQGGELPHTARMKIEDFENDLLEIQHHLEREYRQKSDKRVKHGDTFGTKELRNGIDRKIVELGLIVEDIALCLKTRITAWHLLSLFPSEPQLKLARLKSIEQSIENLRALKAYCEEKMQFEISKVDALFNSEPTLLKRRVELARKLDSSMRTLEYKARRLKEQADESNQLMIDNDRPLCLLLQFEDGKLIGARQDHFREEVQ